MNNSKKVEEFLNFIIDKEREAITKKFNLEVSDSQSKRIDIKVVDDIIAKLEEIEG